MGSEGIRIHREALALRLNYWDLYEYKVPQFLLIAKLDTIICKLVNIVYLFVLTPVQAILFRPTGNYTVIL